MSPYSLCCCREAVGVAAGLYNLRGNPRDTNFFLDKRRNSLCSQQHFSQASLPPKSTALGASPFRAYDMISEALWHVWAGENFYGRSYLILFKPEKHCVGVGKPLTNRRCLGRVIGHFEKFAVPSLGWKIHLLFLLYSRSWMCKTVDILRFQFCNLQPCVACPSLYVV